MRRRDGMWMAGELLGSPTLSAASALIAIADALVGCEANTVLETLDGASIAMFGCQTAPLQERAWRLGGVLRNTLALTPECVDPRGLLIDQALASRRAHPVLIAAIGHELAGRAGVPSHLCATQDGWWTALLDGRRVTLVGSGEAEAPRGDSQVRCICPHQLAGVVLGLLARHDSQPWSGQAHQLARSLPLCHRRDGTS